MFEYFLHLNNYYTENTYVRTLRCWIVPFFTYFNQHMFDVFSFSFYQTVTVLFTMATALPRPKMRGLLQSHLKKHFLIGAAIAVTGAIYVKFFCKYTQQTTWGGAHLT